MVVVVMTGVVVRFLDMTRVVLGITTVVDAIRFTFGIDDVGGPSELPIRVVGATVVDETESARFTFLDLTVVGFAVVVVVVVVSAVFDLLGLLSLSLFL